MDKNKTICNDLSAIIPNDQDISAVEWLAEQMPGGFFIYNANGNMELLYVNKAVCDIFGCNNVEEFRELTGNTFKGMVHPDDFEAIQSSIDDQIASKDNTRAVDYVVYRIIRKDGSVRWVDDYGHFAYLPGHGEVYYVFIEDITDTRVAAEEKEKSKILAEALEHAEQASAAKSSFLSNMSHEIRTPITAILGMNEMIQRETEDSVILEYSENIRKAGVSLLGIISDILDFSKIETGRMELENEEYQITSLIIDLYNLVQLRTEAKGLNLKFTIDPSIPSKLYGDEIRLKQVITNLLTNAVKYTEKGDVEFELKLEEKLEDCVRLQVSVTDTGIGIRKEDMARLFEPFDRLDPNKTRTIEGSGLGLAITRQILALMDSSLEVKSVYGEGSKFWCSFVQKVSDWEEIGEFDPVEHIHSESHSRRKHTLFTAPGLKLLVVDDTPMNLQVVTGLLKRTKIHIDVASSGMECIEKFGKENYNLVFLDYRMPQMNGIETIQEIRRLYPDKFEKTPIISLTASAVSGDKEKMMKAGFTDYLTKPVNVDEMEHMMVKYLPADSVILGESAPEEEVDELDKLPDIIFDFPELDPAKGVEYCGDADDYIYAIETFEKSIDARAASIEEDFTSKNYESYTINVHSLKSTSGAIGATALSEKAKALEQAAKNSDYETVNRDTPGLIDDCRKLKDILGTVLSHHEAAIALTSYNWDEIIKEALDAGTDSFLEKPVFAESIKEELGKMLEERKLQLKERKKLTSLSGCRILLAEDMEINSQIMKQVLGLKDIIADIAVDGEDVLNKFMASAEWYYSAILMDIRMPKMNGLDATRHIRSLEREDAMAVPIIALTVNESDEDIRLSMEAGMNDHLSKPVEPDALFASLEKFIDKRKGIDT